NWRNEITPHLKGADVILLPDNDDAGRNHAKLVAARLNCTPRRTRVLALSGLPLKGDIVDWLAARGTHEELFRLVDAAPKEPEPTEPEIEGEVRRLAGLSDLRYAIERRGAAMRLGVSVGLLDKLVNAARKGSEPQGQGKPLEFPEPESWPEAVSG